MGDRGERKEPMSSTGLMKPRLIWPLSRPRMISPVLPCAVWMRISGYFRAIFARNAGSTPVVVDPDLPYAAKSRKPGSTAPGAPVRSLNQRSPQCRFGARCERLVGFELAIRSFTCSATPQIRPRRHRLLYPKALSSPAKTTETRGCSSAMAIFLRWQPLTRKRGASR